MFEEDIIRIKQEVRDLRTAHLRGLGMVNFSTASGTSSGLSPDYYTYDITITFDESAVFPPICELSSNQSAGGFYYSTWDSANRTLQTKLMNTSDLDPVPVVKAVASTKILSVVVTPVV
jgi:hypothetical protein